jgi:hypothetical protein
MGLPTFPTLPTPPSQENLLLFLIQTVALEELALAALINAEAEKVQAVAAAGVMGPVSASELTAINSAVAAVVEAAGKKEEQLRQKLGVLLAIKDDHGNQPCLPWHK